VAAIRRSRFRSGALKVSPLVNPQAKTREEGNELRATFAGDMTSACDGLDEMIGDLEALHAAVSARFDAGAAPVEPATPLSHSSLMRREIEWRATLRQGEEEEEEEKAILASTAGAPAPAPDAAAARDTKSRRPGHSSDPPLTPGTSRVWNDEMDRSLVSSLARIDYILENIDGAPPTPKRHRLLPTPAIGGSMNVLPEKPSTTTLRLNNSMGIHEECEPSRHVLVARWFDDDAAVSPTRAELSATRRIWEKEEALLARREARELALYEKKRAEQEAIVKDRNRTRAKVSQQQQRMEFKKAMDKVKKDLDTETKAREAAEERNREELEAEASKAEALASTTAAAVAAEAAVASRSLMWPLEPPTPSKLVVVRPEATAIVNRLEEEVHCQGVSEETTEASQTEDVSCVRAMPKPKHMDFNHVSDENQISKANSKVHKAMPMRKKLGTLKLRLVRRSIVPADAMPAADAAFVEAEEGVEEKQKEQHNETEDEQEDRQDEPLEPLMPVDIMKHLNNIPIIAMETMEQERLAGPAGIADPVTQTVQEIIEIIKVEEDEEREVKAPANFAVPAKSVVEHIEENTQEEQPRLEDNQQAQQPQQEQEEVSEEVVLAEPMAKKKKTSELDDEGAALKKDTLLKLKAFFDRKKKVEQETKTVPDNAVSAKPKTEEEEEEEEEENAAELDAEGAALKEDTLRKLEAFFERKETVDHGTKKRVVKKLKDFFNRPRNDMEAESVAPRREDSSLDHASAEGELAITDSQSGRQKQQHSQRPEDNVVASIEEEDEDEEEEEKEEGEEEDETRCSKSMCGTTRLSLEHVVCTILVGFFCMNVCQTALQIAGGFSGFAEAAATTSSPMLRLNVNHHTFNHLCPNACIVFDSVQTTGGNNVDSVSAAECQNQIQQCPRGHAQALLSPRQFTIREAAAFCSAHRCSVTATNGTSLTVSASASELLKAAWHSAEEEGSEATMKCGVLTGQAACVRACTLERIMATNHKELAAEGMSAIPAGTLLRMGECAFVHV
jgi:hypothetical protein